MPKAIITNRPMYNTNSGSEIATFILNGFKAELDTLILKTKNGAFDNPSINLPSLELTKSALRARSHLLAADVFQIGGIHRSLKLDHVSFRIIYICAPTYILELTLNINAESNVPYSILLQTFINA